MIAPKCSNNSNILKVYKTQNFADNESYKTHRLDHDIQVSLSSRQPMGPARRCHSRPCNRPSRRTQLDTSAINSRRSSSTVYTTRHMCRVAARCCQHQTDRCRCLYRTHRRYWCAVAKFSKSRVWNKVLEGSTIILGVISLEHSIA